jgi:Tfp pilus assembly protein PilN
MFGKENDSKSINFLDNSGISSDVWAQAYEWMFSVGKYMLIAVEILALGVFISRFILDEKSNDLSKDINDKVAILAGSNWQQDSITYENIQTLLGDIQKIEDGQDINSVLINEIYNGIPGSLNLLSFSFNNGRISLDLETTNFRALKDYEAALKSNDNYENVIFKLTKTDSKYEITINFSIVESSG